MQEKAANAFFTFAFILGFAFKVPRQVARLRSDYNPWTDWGITEWKINYAAGFARRGLPGTILHATHSITDIALALLAIALSVALFLVFLLYCIGKSRGIIPLWALLSAPLLGFPVYVSQTLVRKDVMLLLLLAVVLRLIQRASTDRRQGIISSLILAGGILSHEMFAFLSIPSSLLFYFATCRRGTGWSLKTVLRREWKNILLIYALPLACLVVVLMTNESQEQATAIANSWTENQKDALVFKQLGGFLQALPSSATESFSQVRSLLGQTHGLIPFWLMVLAGISSAIGLIYIAIPSQEHKVFFLLASIFQFISFSPVFLLGADQGRWIALTASSAMVMLLEASKLIRNTTFSLLGRDIYLFPACQRLTTFSQVGLIFWGFPLVGWSLQKYLWSTPFGTVFLKTYFVARTLDFSAIMK